MSEARFGPAHVVALDQEGKALHAVVDGNPLDHPFDPSTDLDLLPVGGGVVVADVNSWTVRNDYSQSQYVWPDVRAREDFLTALSLRGYRALAVTNKHANTLFLRYGYDQPEAVLGLYAYAHDALRTSAAEAGRDEGPGFSCGCTRHGRLDAARPVERIGGGDRSFGHRDTVVRDFLRLQNAGGYDSPFAEAVIDIAAQALTPAGKPLFNLKKRGADLLHGQKPSKLMAVAVCTHDPGTGDRRTHAGQPWGTGFIVDRVIGLNGTMVGVGKATAGNPMRAYLRSRGALNGKKYPVKATERTLLDQQVRTLIGALREHPTLPAAWAPGTY